MQLEKVLLTAEELMSLPDTGHRYELIKGRLIQMPSANLQHGSVANRLAFYLTSYVLANGLGEVFAQDTGFILSRNPDTVRAPDVAFIARERLPEQLPALFSELSPDLVAEVVSPNDRPREVQTKVQDWLRAGVQLVWVVYPVTATIEAFYSDRSIRHFASDHDLDAEPVLSGFRCRVADLFN